MKKYACLLLFAIMLNGCDDGDLTEEKIDFSDVNPAACDTKTNDLLYKLKSQESLLLKLPNYTLAPEIGAPEVGTKEYDIVANGAYQLVYRAYNGIISTANICDAIRPSSPIVTNEWFATGGIIKIVTKPNEENKEDGATAITGFNHLITLEKITYSKPTGSQVDNPEITFGTITTSYPSPGVTFVNNVGECSTTKQLYNYTSTYSMTIDNVDPALIVEAETPAGTARTSTITATQNKVVYNTYNGAIDANYFCNSTPPASPTVNTIWNGSVGGIIAVETTKSGTTFTHTITLRNVELVNGSLSFKLGNNYILGKLTK